MDKRAAKKIDFTRVNIDDLDEYIQLFYDEDVN